MKQFFKHRLSRELKRLARQSAGEGRPLSVMDDAVFKAVLASDNEDSREALRHLLSACIGREVSTVRILSNEILPPHLAAKSVRLDINLTFNDGEAANLEMQLSKSDDSLKDRAAQYAAILLAGQSRRGKLYREIKRVYQIFFLNFTLFPGSGKLPRRYSYREEQEHDRLTEAVEIIFYELPKLERRVRDYLAGKAGVETLREDEKWCIYMKYRHEQRAEPLIEELCRKGEGIMRAEKAMAKVDRDYVRYIRKMDIIKNSMDRASLLYNGGLAEGRAEGLTEGLTQGKAEANLEIARNALAEGATPEFVQKITGLDLKTIEKLRLP